MSSMELTRKRPQELPNETSEWVVVAHATHQLEQIVRYGDPSQFDLQPMLQLIEELFAQEMFSFFAAANCNNSVATPALVGIDKLD